MGERNVVVGPAVMSADPDDLPGRLLAVSSQHEGSKPAGQVPACA
jgi:hypothetical protein